MSVEGPEPIWHYTTEEVRIRKFCVGAWENNVYVVACARTGNAVIVDAAAEADKIIASTSDVRPQAILTTHGHFDHVGAAPEVAQRLAIPFLVHPADATAFDLEADEALKPGKVKVGNLRIDVMATPGHTPGSLCLGVDGVLLSGDTLFPGGPGATRGPGSDFGQIMDSIDALFELPDTTLVMPGHGLDTTIGTERPSAAQWRARGW